MVLSGLGHTSGSIVSRRLACRPKMTDEGWSIRRLTFVLYPFGAGAAAVNIFFASLIGSWMGFPVLSPIVSLLGGVVLGFPVTFIFAKHIRKLIDKTK